MTLGYIIAAKWLYWSFRLVQSKVPFLNIYSFNEENREKHQHWGAVVRQRRKMSQRLTGILVWESADRGVGEEKIFFLLFL